jgi:hypothetical protein
MLVARPLGSKNKATAVCDVGDAVGDLVYVTGSMSGADYSVAKADVLAYAKMPTIAVITYKITATKAVIQFRDDVVGIYTGLLPGRVYFVGLDSKPTAVPPAPGAGQKLYLQPIGVAVDATVLRLNPINDMKVRVG